MIHNNCHNLLTITNSTIQNIVDLKLDEAIYYYNKINNELLFKINSKLLGNGSIFYNENLTPLSNGKIYSFEAGTIINKPTYMDNNWTLQNTNPIILNEEGKADIHLKGLYDLHIYDENDNLVAIQKNVMGALSAEEIIDFRVTLERFKEGVVTSENLVNDLTNQTIAFVNDAINNTAVEGGILADTFVTVTTKGDGGVARTLKDVNSERFSVKDFGAVGDGITNDGPAIRATILAASNAGGGTVFFPPSKPGYAADFGSVSNIHNVVIDGNNQTIIHINHLINANSNRSPIYIVNGSNITVHSLTSDGNFLSGSVDNTRRVNNHNLAFSNVVNLRIYNCILKDCGYPNSTIDEAGDSIYIVGDSENIWIENNTFINPSRWSISFQYNSRNLSGIYINNNSQLVDRPNKILGFVDLEYNSAADKPTVVSEIYIQNNSVFFGCMIACSNSSFENLNIVNNKFRGYTSSGELVYKDTTFPYGFGIAIGSRAGRPSIQNLTISDNVFDSVIKQNIEISFSNINTTITNNYIYTNPNSPNSFSKGIRLINATNCNVSNNVVVDGVSGGDSMLFVSGSGNVLNNIITQNYRQNFVSINCPLENGVLLFSGNQIYNYVKRDYALAMTGNVVCSDNIGLEGTYARAHNDILVFKDNTNISLGGYESNAVVLDTTPIKRVYSSTNTPVYNAHTSIGDVVYSRNPNALGYIGWVCTAVDTTETTAEWTLFGALKVEEVITEPTYVPSYTSVYRAGIKVYDNLTEIFKVTNASIGAVVSIDTLVLVNDLNRNTGQIRFEAKYEAVEEIVPVPEVDPEGEPEEGEPSTIIVNKWVISTNISFCSSNANILIEPDGSDLIIKARKGSGGVASIVELEGRILTYNCYFETIAPELIE